MAARGRWLSRALASILRWTHQGAWVPIDQIVRSIRRPVAPQHVLDELERSANSQGPRFQLRIMGGILCARAIIPPQDVRLDEPEGEPAAEALAPPPQPIRPLHAQAAAPAHPRVLHGGRQLGRAPDGRRAAPVPQALPAPLPEANGVPRNQARMLMRQQLARAALAQPRPRQRPPAQPPVPP